MSKHNLRSNIVMAHTRKATMGMPSYRNAQPFVREMAGRMHCFAHNGWLPEILGAHAFRSSRFTRVGATDSEQDFCTMLERLSPLWISRGVIPPLEDRLDRVATFAADPRRLGPVNFLYSDGDALFAHGDRRKSPLTVKVAAPGLVFLQSECPPTGAVITGTGVSVSAVDQAVVLVASVPLSIEPWQEMADGQIAVLRAGRIAGQRFAG